MTRMEIEFRIGTKMEEIGYRSFSFIVIYYEDKTITSWADLYPFYKDDNLDDMKRWLTDIEEAMKKPIIDLDNFPTIYEAPS